MHLRFGENREKAWNTAALLLWSLFIAVWLFRLSKLYRAPNSPYDDAYMFYRYALNLRAGSGVSWNPDGVHTYGVTSPGWLFCVWLCSFCTQQAGAMLRTASKIFAILGLLSIGAAVAWNARTPLLRRIGVPALIASLLLLTGFHDVWEAACNGMETMLGMLLVAVMAGVVLRWTVRGSPPFLVSVVAFALFLTRPESALTSCTMILCSYFFLAPSRRREAVQVIGFFLMAVCAELVLCKYYFGSALPLSFYIKSHHAYIGYLGRWRPVTMALRGIKASIVPLAAVLLLGRRRDARVVVICIVPALLTYLYLTTTLQIMGFSARYYVPYLPLFFIPAFLVVDRGLDEQALLLPLQSGQRWLRIIAVVLFGLSLPSILNRHLLTRLDQISEGPMLAYDKPLVVTNSIVPLPYRSLPRQGLAVADDLVRDLPAGTTIAASEVGYLGIATPQSNIVDLAGLNDTQIALHGFTMDYLLSLRPDVIWFPHYDYTQQRGVMISDPRLLTEYDFYPDAGAFGLALRRDSPYRDILVQRMSVYWNALYPGIPMKAHLAQGVDWSGRAHLEQPLLEVRK